MRTVPPLTAAVLALALPSGARPAELKIGYIEMSRVVQEIEEGKAAKTQLSKEFEEKQKRLNDAQADLKKMKEDFDKQALVMADEAKRERQAELDRKFMEVQNTYLQMQQELSGKEREVMKGIFERVAKLASEIAEAEGFAYIFEKDSSGMVYGPPALNLTNELVRKYNARFKVGAGEGKKKAAKPEAGK